MTYFDALVADWRFAYVWPCYALAALAMAGLAVDAYLRLKRAADAAKSKP
ncbi:MAG: heme exporter protein CcmD [Caulobacterales bacterium]|jgi:heme exporter protein D